MLQKIVVEEASVVSEGWRINFVFETGVTNLWLLAKGHKTPNSDMNRVTQFCTTATKIKSLQVFPSTTHHGQGQRLGSQAHGYPLGYL